MEPPIWKDCESEIADYRPVPDALSTYIGKRIAKIKE